MNSELPILHLVKLQAFNFSEVIKLCQPHVFSKQKIKTKIDNFVLTKMLAKFPVGQNLVIRLIIYNNKQKIFIKI